MIACAPGETTDHVRVTFTLAPDGSDRSEVSLVGDFNDWDPAANPFRRSEEGVLSATVLVPAGCRYRFRYLSESGWLNDEAAHDYEPNAAGGTDGVLDLSDVATTLARGGPT